MVESAAGQPRHDRMGHFVRWGKLTGKLDPVKRYLASVRSAKAINLSIRSLALASLEITSASRPDLRGEKCAC